LPQKKPADTDAAAPEEPRLIAKGKLGNSTPDKRGNFAGWKRKNEGRPSICATKGVVLIKKPSSGRQEGFTNTGKSNCVYAKYRATNDDEC